MAKLHSHSRLSKNRNYVKDVIGYPQSQTNRTNVVPVPGEKGDTPYIGGNDNWWIGGVDTGVYARAEDGDTPYVGGNGNWWVGEEDTGIEARGEKGDTPYIGDNDNWWIGGVDTGHSAMAEQNPPARGEDIFNK